MNSKRVLSIVALAMIGGTALLLAAIPQTLGRPGVKTEPIPGDVRCQIDLPETVMGFQSTNLAADAETLEMLPKDTSIGQRIYYKPGALPVTSGVVLMGTDRTSIHKADYCLRGEGFQVLQIARDTVPMTQPKSYDLPIIKILASGTFMVDGKPVTKHCIYVYWYVTDGALSNDRSGMERMWSMAKKLVFTGVLQRWAYVRFYAFCDPGQENAAFDEIKGMITEAVPQFQLTPQPNTAMAAQR